MRVYVPNPKQSMCGGWCFAFARGCGIHVLGTNRFLVLKILFHVTNKSPKDGVFCKIVTSIIH